MGHLSHLILTLTHHIRKHLDTHIYVFSLAFALLIHNNKTKDWNPPKTLSHTRGRTPELRQTKTTVTIYTTREQPPITKICYMVKVFTNTTTVTRIESQSETSTRSETLRPENRVRRGTPRVMKLYGQGSQDQRHRDTSFNVFHLILGPRVSGRPEDRVRRETVQKKVTRFRGKGGKKNSSPSHLGYYICMYSLVPSDG